MTPDQILGAVILALAVAAIVGFRVALYAMFFPKDDD